MRSISFLMHALNTFRKREVLIYPQKRQNLRCNLWVSDLSSPDENDREIHKPHRIIRRLHNTYSYGKGRSRFQF